MHDAESLHEVGLDTTINHTYARMESLTEQISFNFTQLLWHGIEIRHANENTTFMNIFLTNSWSWALRALD